jgi:hypothetical protein
VCRWLEPASLDQHSAQARAALARLAPGREVDRQAQENDDDQNNGYDYSHTANATLDHAYTPRWAVS